VENVNNYFGYRSHNIYNLIGGNEKLTGEFFFIRRLFIDWIKSKKDFYNLKKYQSFKSVLKKHIKSMPNDDLKVYFTLWIDFQLFLKNHREFLSDIYDDCVEDNPSSGLLAIMVFSMISVNFFYKWRKKRNDSKRSWYGYDNRRKKPSNIQKVFFDNIILDEARSYRYYNLHRANYSSYVKFY